MKHYIPEEANHKMENYLPTCVHHVVISPPNKGQNLICIEPLGGEVHILEVTQILKGDSDITLYRFHSCMVEQGSLTNTNHTNNTAQSGHNS